MKKVISLVTIAFSFNVFATSVRPMPRPMPPPRDGVKANMFECSARNDTEVNYTTTSKIGTPTLQVRFQGDDAKFTSDINTENSALGKLVYADDAHMVPVDGPMVRYTILMPEVILKNNGMAETFETVLVRQSKANRLFGPRTGAFTHSESVNVECTAQFVWF
jgi:hypothetical protein